MDLSSDDWFKLNYMVLKKQFKLCSVSHLDASAQMFFERTAAPEGYPLPFHKLVDSHAERKKLFLRGYWGT